MNCKLVFRNIVCIATFICCTVLPIVLGASWSYRGSDGPSKWHNSFPKCGGDVQSPINIETIHVLNDEYLTPIQFSDYSTNPYFMKLANNGHSLKVDVNSSMTISEGGLNATYHLAQFHFHSGTSNQKGSEHTINRNAHAAEIHFVHYLGTEADLGSAAALEPNGLAVLGVFIEVGESDNPAYANLVDKFSDVKFKGEETDVTPFPLEGLLPGDKSYYRYQGSLTTPPCYESVQWTVFKTSVTISQSQMNEFRTVMEKEEGSTGNKNLFNNFRPTQSLNERQVYSSFN